MKFAKSRTRGRLSINVRRATPAPGENNEGATHMIDTATNVWGAITDGTAVGTTELIHISGTEDAVAVTPLWSDVDGVSVDLYVPDTPLDLDAVGRLADLLDRLRGTLPPQL